MVIMSRFRVAVEPRPQGKWAVEKSSNSKASSLHRKKSAAVRKAKRMAKRNKPSELIIKKSNGRIQDKHSYGRDPRRYSG
jgi:hypothetical protein